MPSRLKFHTDLYGSCTRPSMDTALPVDGSGQATPPTTRPSQIPNRSLWALRPPVFLNKPLNTNPPKPTYQPYILKVLLNLLPQRSIATSFLMVNTMEENK